MGEDVFFLFFWKTEWQNGDKPPPKRRKMVVFSPTGTWGGGKLGDGQRKNGGKRGELGKNRAEVADTWGGGA